MPGITWESCKTYTYDWFNLGDRMTCGEVEVPVDYSHPEAGTIPVSVVRIAAAQSDHRRGVIVVNPGGPGARTGLTFAQDVYGYWNAGDPNDPVGSLLKQITDEYDIVGFMPRGTGTFEEVVGSGDDSGVSDPGDNALICQSDQPVPNFIDPDDRSLANIARMQAKARTIANGCQGASRKQAAYVNTESTVRDLDVIRQALGDQKISFYGTSYGTWMGTWYAALFLGNIDHLVLDSSMDFTGLFADALLNQIGSIQSVMEAKIFPNVIRRPDYFNLGTTVASINNTMRQLPPEVRKTVRNFNVGDILTGDPSPQYPIAGLALAAGNGVAQLLKNNPLADLDTMLALVNKYTFSSDASAQGRARLYARSMVKNYFSATGEQPLKLDVSASVYNAVTCNDTPLFSTDPGVWASLGDAISIPARFVDTEDVTGNPCIYWSNQFSAHKPDQTALKLLPPTLMLQLQFDPLTPLSGAKTLHAAIPSSSLVTVQGGVGHDVIAKENDCASKWVGEYFIHGTLPAPNTVCAANGAKSASVYANPERAEKIREQLQQTIIDANHVGNQE